MCTSYYFFYRQRYGVNDMRLPQTGAMLRPVFLKLFEVGAHLKFLKKLWAQYTQNLTKFIAKCKKTEKKEPQQGDIYSMFLYSLFISC